MSCRIFVGNLPLDIKEREVDDLFYKYGKIRDIDIKTPARPPAFAFVTFDNVRDAEDAIHGRDGYNFDGLRLRVEMSKGDRDRYGGAGGRDAPRRTGGGRRTDFGVIVTGLPRSTSWQDLKDFMRKAGDVVYADVDRNGDGIVDFSNRDDMERAVDKLDDTEFRNPLGSSNYIRVKFANKHADRSRSRDRDARRRSPSRSRSRDRRAARDHSDDERSRSRDRSDGRKARDEDEDDGRKPSGDDAAPASETKRDAEED